MQAYIKKVKIVPELDLSLFEQQLGSIPKEFGKFMDDLRKPFDDLQKDFTFNIDKNENLNKNIKTVEEVDKVIKEEIIPDKLNPKSVIKEIDKALEEKTFLNQGKDSKMLMYDFLKGLQSELQFIPLEQERTIKLEKINELDNLIKYLQEGENKIQESISTLKEDLKNTEGYDYYQQNLKDVAQLEANRKEIARLKISGKDDAATLNKIEELKEANEKLDERIRSFEVIKDDFKELITILSSIEELDAKYNELWKEREESKEEKEDLEKEVQKDSNNNWFSKIDWGSIGKVIGSKIYNSISSLLSKYVKMWGEILTEALDEFDRMSQYSLDTSLRVNTEAREQALMYGLSDAQNYALTRVKEEMGISSEEDMLMMTPAQQERFAERIGYYTDQYSQISNEDLFSKYEEYQKEVQDFQNEFEMEVIEFFAENKDTIITVMEFLMNVLESIMKAVTWIVDAMGGDKERSKKENASVVSDTINSYAIANTNNSTNVKIDNSFTNIPIKDQQQYVNAGKRVNEQLINALDGRLGG